MVGCKSMYHYYCYIISNDYKKHVVMDIIDSYECVKTLYEIHSEIMYNKMINREIVDYKGVIEPFI